jgi:hypothetical protein
MTEAPGAHPLRVTHVELRQCPQWHGVTHLPPVAADECGEPIYDTGEVQSDADRPQAG